MDVDDDKEDIERRVEAYALIPALIIRAMTADKSAYLPTRESYVFKWAKIELFFQFNPCCTNCGRSRWTRCYCLVPHKRSWWVYCLSQLCRKAREAIGEIASGASISRSWGQAYRVSMNSKAYSASLRLILGLRMLQTFHGPDRSFRENIKFIVLHEYDNQLRDLSGLQSTCTITGLSVGCPSCSSYFRIKRWRKVCPAKIEENCFLFSSLVLQTDKGKHRFQMVTIHCSFLLQIIMTSFSLFPFFPGNLYCDQG